MAHILYPSALPLPRHGAHGAVCQMVLRLLPVVAGTVIVIVKFIEQAELAVAPIHGGKDIVHARLGGEGIGEVETQRAAHILPSRTDVYHIGDVLSIPHTGRINVVDAANRSHIECLHIPHGGDDAVDA